MCLVSPLPDPQTQTLSTTFEEGDSLLLHCGESLSKKWRRGVGYSTTVQLVDALIG